MLVIELSHNSHKTLMLIVDLKGISPGPKSEFLHLVKGHLCPLKFLDLSIINPWFAMANITHLSGKNRSGGSVMLLDPWMSP